MARVRVTEEVLRCLAEKQYTYLCFLGEGAFSKVYLVRDNTGAEWACKASGQRALLEREAALLSRARHQSIPAFREYFTREALGFLVMEYVRGEILTRPDTHGKRAASLVDAALQLADTLMYLHEGLGVLYRDLKPENVMIGDEGKLKLIDFGCVVPIGGGRGEMAGTPGFAAPEQLAGAGDLTRACDVYAFGKILAFLLGCGSEPHRKTCRIRVGRIRVRPIKIRPMKARRILWRLVEACTRKEPQLRLPDMRSVTAALENTYYMHERLSKLSDPDRRATPAKLSKADRRATPAKHSDWDRAAMAGDLRVENYVRIVSAPYAWKLGR